jgi:hypothetical protein
VLGLLFTKSVNDLTHEFYPIVDKNQKDFVWFLEDFVRMIRDLCGVVRK